MQNIAKQNSRESCGTRNLPKAQAQVMKGKALQLSHHRVLQPLVERRLIPVAKASKGWNIIEVKPSQHLSAIKWSWGTHTTVL